MVKKNSFKTIIDVSESVLDISRNSRGRPFHSDGPFTQKHRVSW